MAASLAMLTACDYDGVTSIPLPFREGTGEGALTITVRLDEASGLTPNSEVKVDDVTVGSVDSIDVDGWEPVAKIRINKDVELPANAVARVGQKSLLGAKYLELAPPEGIEAVGRLETDSTVEVSTSGNYPQTEQVLASLSLVLNGGGLQQVRTITEELDSVLTGREPQARAFLRRFKVFISSLNRQRNDIVAVVERLNRLSTTLSRDNVVATALERLPAALASLDRDRTQLTKALTALSGLGRTAKQVVRESGGALVANLRNLQPALAGLARSGSNLTESLSVAATYPFPGNTSFPRMFQGDYGNLFITLDVSPALLRRNLLHGFQATAAGDSLMEGPPLGAGDGPPSAGQLVPNLPGLSQLEQLPILPGLTGGEDRLTLSGLFPGLLPRRTGTTSEGDR